MLCSVAPKYRKTHMTLNLVAKKTEENQVDHYTVDSFLNYFNVPRQNAIYEMTLPGYVIGEDQLVEQLDPGAALLHVLYRATKYTEHLASFIEMMRSDSRYLSGNVVTKAGRKAAERIIVTVELKKPVFNDEGEQVTVVQENLYKAALLQNGRRIALVNRDGLYINPNAYILETKEIEARLSSEDHQIRDIKGNTFFVPAPVAEGLLLKPTEDESRQSTSMRCVFPQGAMFLDSWFWAEARGKRLQRNKWSEFSYEESDETEKASS